MVLFTPKGKIRKFKTVKDIVDTFCRCRLTLYTKRKNWLVNELDRKLTLAKNKMRYLQDVMNQSLVIFKIPEVDIIQELETKNFDKLGKKVNYDYLLNMSNRSFTKDKLETLKKEIDDYENEKHTIMNTSPEDIWLRELKNLSTNYKKWIKKMTY
jgi:DNA gyrase/topoisomerase IV subunit A